MTGPLDPALTSRWDHERVAADIASQAGAIPTATLHEAAGRTGDLPPAIKPIDRAFRVAGPAVTVTCPNGDNLWIHRALCVARPGEILVVQTGGGPDFGYWGEVMSTLARARKLGGLVIDGCVRDVPLLRELGFPVFARGVCIRGTIKDLAAPGWVNAPILIGQIVVQAGDLIVGDEDGVVALPRNGADAVVRDALAREAKEANMCAKLEQGATTLELLGLS